MKNALKRFGGFITRIDVMNRILVILSMAFFLVIPSMVLYYLNESNFSLEVVVPCLMVIGLVVGTGLFCLYKPIRTSFFYFIETGFVLFMYHDFFLSLKVEGIHGVFDMNALFWIQIVYCLIAVFLNLIYFIKSLNRYLKSKIAFNENTNADSLYDFLNGGETNKTIEKKVSEIMPDSSSKNRMNFLKNVKLSRIFRVVSFVAFAMIFFDTIVNIEANTLSLVYVPAINGLLSLFFLLLFSVYLPGDFKYLYYYTGIFTLVMMILCASECSLNPFFMIIVLIIFSCALLVTLITEGRTWTGAQPDSK
ncbi:MAG: hypothetical protein WCR67_00070 [Bacilli bacterium]